MRPLAVASIVSLLAAFLAGCSAPEDAEGGRTPPAVDGQAMQHGFDGGHGTVPQGWEVLEGDWGINHTPDPAYAAVMEGTGTTAEPSDCLTADPEGGFSCLLAPAGNFRDVEVQVSFNVLAPANVAGGAGLVIHFEDPDNYQIVRYSVREQGWHLFTVHEGNREKQRDASTQNQTNPGSGTWVTLRVVSEDGRVKAYDGGTEVIDYTLPEGHATVGRVGLFLRDDTTAQFDGFSVQPLGAQPGQQGQGQAA